VREPVFGGGLATKQTPSDKLVVSGRGIPGITNGGENGKFMQEGRGEESTVHKVATAVKINSTAAKENPKQKH